MNHFKKFGPLIEYLESEAQRLSITLKRSIKADIEGIKEEGKKAKILSDDIEEKQLEGDIISIFEIGAKVDEIFNNTNNKYIYLATLTPKTIFESYK